MKDLMTAKDRKQAISSNPTQKEIAMQYELSHLGKVLFTSTNNECINKLRGIQENSPEYALQFEGYEINKKQLKQAISDNPTKGTIPMKYEDVKKSIAKEIEIQNAYKIVSLDKKDYMEAGYQDGVIYGLWLARRRIRLLQFPQEVSKTEAATATADTVSSFEGPRIPRSTCPECGKLSDFYQLNDAHCEKNDWYSRCCNAYIKEFKQW